MDNKSKIVLVIGIIITLGLLLFSIYAAGIAFILVITLVMSLQIMQDSVSRPDIVANLAEDAKAVIIKNSGNSPARNIHVALVPLNTEYDVKFLAADESDTHALGSMIQDVKVVVTFENDEKMAFTRSYALSVSGEYEPFKPMIPVFKWK